MTEIIIVIALALVILGAASFFFKNDTAKVVPFLFVAAFAGPIAAQMGLKVRELVEGPFGYLDIVFAMACGMIFVAILQSNGTFETILENITASKRSPIMLAMALMFLIALPGMLTGSAMVCIASTGMLVGKYLISKGVNKKHAVEFVSVSALIGMALPPISIPAAFAIFGRAGSYPSSYVGFFPAILVGSLVAFIVYAVVCANRIFGSTDVTGARSSGKSISMLPLAVVIVLLLCHELLPGIVPFIGYPGIFTIGAVLAFVMPAKKTNVVEGLFNEYPKYLSAAAYLFGIGALIEMLVLTGVAGTISKNMLISNTTTVFYIVVSVAVIAIGFVFGGVTASVPAAIGVYCIANLAYGAGLDNIVLIGMSSIIAVSFFLTLKGGIIGNTAKTLDVAEGEYSNMEAIVGGIAPVAVLIIVAVVFMVMPASLKFLVI